MMETDYNDASNLNALKDMILDEGKLITYIILSKDLCIHVNKSKVLMKNFIQTIRQEQPTLQLNINYLISGLIDDKNCKLTICSEDKLHDCKKLFKIVFYDHVYSISKGISSDDITPFVCSNNYDDLILCPGVIKSSDSIKRSHEEIFNLKSSSQPTISETKPALPHKKPLTEVQAKSSNLKNGSINGIIKTEPKIDKEIKTEILSPKKDQQSSKQNNNRSAAQKGIVGFFNKQNGDIKKNKVSNIQPIVPKVEKDVSNEKEVVDIETDIKYENGTSNNNKVLNHIKKHSKVDKKRKRVLHVSDSESEDENDPFVGEEDNKNVHESDDEIPPTPAANNLKITTGIVNPRKKRKIVDKTYMSDDGYIVTKREEVYESCSDSENNIEKVQPRKHDINIEKSETSPKSKSNEVKISPKKKKKMSPSQKKTQPTLMNFFKKK